jgi:hypothetical protein
MFENGIREEYTAILVWGGASTRSASLIGYRVVRYSLPPYVVHIITVYHSAVLRPTSTTYHALVTQATHQSTANPLATANSSQSATQSNESEASSRANFRSEQAQSNHSNSRRLFQPLSLISTPTAAARNAQVKKRTLWKAASFQK